MIKIILADDHHIVRKGIKLLVSEDTEIQIVAEAANGLQVMEQLRNNAEVDLVLADLNMPEMDGVALAKQLKHEYPDIPLIILSMVQDHDLIAQSIKNGACGYLFKNSDAMELIFAIKFVAGGSKYLCSELSIDLLDKQQKNSEKIIPRDLHGFTERELEVLHFIAEGLTNSEIAEKIFVSKRTAEGHRQSLLEKTGSRNTAVLIKKAVLEGLI